MRASSLKILALAIAAALAAPACETGGGSESEANEGGSVTLVLGAYTTPREAYGKAILPAFREHWKRTTGRDVEFQESYQGSGAQSRAIVGGFAQLVVLLTVLAWFLLRRPRRPR